MSYAPALLGVSKHPLTIVLISTALGSILIPRVNARIAQHTRIAELRLQYVQRASATSTDVNRKLNAVVSAFETFVKDDVTEDGAFTPAARETLKNRVYALYEEFDKDAWWWHWQYLEDVKLLKLVSGDAERAIDVECQSYQENVVASVDELNKIWTCVLRKQHPQIEQVPAASTRLKELQAKRQAIVRTMVAPLLD